MMALTVWSLSIILYASELQEPEGSRGQQPARIQSGHSADGVGLQSKVAEHWCDDRRQILIAKATERAGIHLDFAPLIQEIGGKDDLPVITRCDECLDQT